jgi:opacity protein-like surface antigen
LVIGICLLASPAAAQSREFSFRGFADVGSTTFTAADSFKAVLGSERGMVFGGGVEAVLPQRIFVSLRASHFRETGERLFIFNNEQFDLGIPATITVTPIELTGGYRFDFGWPVIPYAGGGAGWHRYEETSSFADASENVKEQFTGYQILGGAELRLARWIGAAAEAQWAKVADALGQDPNAVSTAFSESDLGGVTFRVKVVIGR